MSVHAISSAGLFCPVVQSSVFFAAGRFRAVAGETVAGCSLFLRRSLPTFGLRRGIAATAARCSAQLPVRAEAYPSAAGSGEAEPACAETAFLAYCAAKKEIYAGIFEIFA